MKFATFEVDGHQTYGALRDDGMVDLSRRLPDYPTLKSLISADFPPALEAAMRGPVDYKETEISYLPPIPDPAHVWCLALNYIEHHDEVQNAGRVQELPKEPAMFARYADSLTGHGHPICHPGVSEQLDFEGELGVVIGKPGRNIAQSDAFSHVAGYTVINEGSVRDWQFHTRQITPGKNFYHSGAIGPWLVRRDDVKSVYDLSIKTTVNGTLMQDGNSADMVHKIERFIEYASTVTPLLPGDILATGTPSGVGFSRKPPVWLRPGDVCEITIAGIGTLRNSVAEAK